MAEDNLNAAQEVLAEVEPELWAVEDQYYEAQWQRDNANTNEEWEAADVEFRRLADQKRSMEERRNVAQDAVDALEPDMDRLRQELADATQAREDKA